MKTSGTPAPSLPTVWRRGIRSATALALLILFALALAGCGSSPPAESSADKTDPENERPASTREPSSLEAVQVAYRNTTARDTARVSTEISISGMPEPPTSPGQSSAGPAEMRMTSQGVIDFSDGSYAQTMRMPYLGRVQYRQIGDTLYQKYPPEFRAQLTGGKPWAEVDLDALPQQYGAGSTGTGGAQSSDPTMQLSYLKSVSDSVEKVGEEEIRGVATTHYRAKVDLGKDLEQYDPETRQAYEEIVEELDGERLPVDVWLDGEGQVRRYEMTMPLILPEDPSSPNGAMKTEPGGSISMAQELYDFGTPVNIEPPPPSQTVDITDMMVEQNSTQL